MKYLLLFLLPFSLYASKVLSYNIYERSDRADVMITFDTPFHGSIKQSKSSDNTIIIKLQDATIESMKTKSVHSDFLHALKIKPLENQIYIYASISPHVKLTASKTTDAYGLRLRFTKAKTNNQASEGQGERTNTFSSSLPTKKGTEISTSYIVVVSLLLIGIVLLFLFKKKITTSQIKKGKNSWLFNSTLPNQQQTTNEEITTLSNSQQNSVSIRFQKNIDAKNSVVMLDFGDESYLIFMGNSNILLDKFKDNKPTSQQEFDTILQERNKELEDFLGTTHTQNDSHQGHKREPFEAYTERASLIYSEEE